MSPRVSVHGATRRVLSAVALGSVAVALLGACRPTANVGLNWGMELPADAGKTCDIQCFEAGLPLDAVVVLHDTVACICRPAGAAASSPERHVRRLNAGVSMALTGDLDSLILLQ